MTEQRTSKSAIVINRIVGIISSILGYTLTTLFVLVLLTGSSKTKSTTIVFIILLALSVYLIIFGIKTKKVIKRFRKYVNIISMENETSIENIATACSESTDFVTKNLQEMINRKFFTSAYIDKNANRIILERKNTTAANEAVNNNKTVKFKVTTCKNCGASNRIPVNTASECEFCGSAIDL